VGEEIHRDQFSGRENLGGGGAMRLAAGLQSEGAREVPFWFRDGY
jgi:hypothetical protein